MGHCQLGRNAGGALWIGLPVGRIQFVDAHGDAASDAATL